MTCSAIDPLNQVSASSIPTMHRNKYQPEIQSAIVKILSPFFLTGYLKIMMCLPHIRHRLQYQCKTAAASASS